MMSLYLNGRTFCFYKRRRLTLSVGLFITAVVMGTAGSAPKICCFSLITLPRTWLLDADLRFSISSIPFTLIWLKARNLLSLGMLIFWKETFEDRLTAKRLASRWPFADWFVRIFLFLFSKYVSYKCFAYYDMSRGINWSLFMMLLLLFSMVAILEFWESWI